jgi:hypothetical protein
MYLCAKGIEFASSYNFSMGLKNCSDNMELFVFSIGLWNCSKKNNIAKLSEHFLSPIEKPIMLHCRNSSKVP